MLRGNHPHHLLGAGEAEARRVTPPPLELLVYRGTADIRLCLGRGDWDVGRID
jgi:hypothetical protein